MVEPRPAKADRQNLWMSIVSGINRAVAEVRSFEAFEAVASWTDQVKRKSLLHRVKCWIRQRAICIIFSPNCLASNPCFSTTSY